MSEFLNLYLKKQRQAIAKHEGTVDPQVNAILASDVSIHDRFDDSESYLKDWREKGKPACWQLAETVMDESFEVWVDVGYGNIALYDVKQKLIVSGKEMLKHPSLDIIVLDKEYFGTKRYLHIPVI